MPTFLVEDGTGVEDATSYVTEAFADDYLGASWAADSQAKQAALMAASEYMDARWGSQLRGRPLVATQGLEMPRAALVDRYGAPVEGVPLDWAKAACLYAKEAAAGTLYPADPGTNPKEIKKKKVVVGPITTETEYKDTGPSSTVFRIFVLADRLAGQFTSSGLSGQTKVIRN